MTGETRLVVRVCKCGQRWAGGNSKYCPAGHAYDFDSVVYVPADEAQAEVTRLTKRVGELEGALGDIADYSMGEYDNCPDCGGPARARAALATQEEDD